jgi:hypothetical protein
VDDGLYSAAFIQAFFARYSPDLVEHWHYQHLDAEHWGMSQSAFGSVVATCDVFLNVSGSSRIPAGLPDHCVKAFIDTDPGYNQIVYSERFEWSENVDRWCDLVDAHDVHFTYAENIGAPDCLVPDVGLDWLTTRMPVVHDLWDVVPPPPKAPWTTVMTWNAFKGKVTFKGSEYHSKGYEFERLVDLPSRVGHSLEVALGGIDAPVERLQRAGWNVTDAPSETLTPEKYQQFIHRSRGEISCAKHVYVALRTGWFSTRSACYLASGRPVVVQDTSLPAELSGGVGILTFTSVDEAVDAIEEAEANYSFHSEAARSIASEYFDARTVLDELLQLATAGGRTVEVQP